MILGKAGVDRAAPARAALEKGKFDWAYLLAEDGYGIDPWERKAILAKAATGLRRYDLAESHYRALLEHDETPDLQCEFGMMFAAMNRTEDAVFWLRKGLSRSNRNSDACGVLGRILLKQREYTEAWQYLSTALETSFKYVDLISFLVESAMRSGRLAEVEAILARYVDFYPANADIACEYVRVLAHLDRKEEAVKRLEPLRLLHPGHSRIQELSRMLLDEAAE